MTRRRFATIYRPLMDGLMDTRRMMSEESTTPDLVELVRLIFEAADRAGLG